MYVAPFKVKYMCRDLGQRVRQYLNIYNQFSVFFFLLLCVRNFPIGIYL